MYLAVLIYKFVTSKPPGIPDSWPAQVLELGDVASLPDGLSADNGWVIMDNNEYLVYRAQYQLDYDAWYMPAMAPTPQQIALAKVKAATIFGQALVQQIEADNIVAGLTVQQVGLQLRDYGSLLAMLQSGSLITALAVSQNLQAVDGMTPDRINSYIAQIRAFLGMQ